MNTCCVVEPRASPDRLTPFEDGFGSGAFAFRQRLSLAALVAVLALVGVASLLALRQYDSGKQKALNEAHARVVLAGTILDAYFQGELSTLGAIAAAPAVVARDEVAMRSYFLRVQPPTGSLFSGGIGWIDANGNSRVSSTIPEPNISERLRPFVLQGSRLDREAVCQRRLARARKPQADRRHGGADARHARWPDGRARRIAQSDADRQQQGLARPWLRRALDSRPRRAARPLRTFPPTKHSAPGASAARASRAPLRLQGTRRLVGPRGRVCTLPSSELDCRDRSSALRRLRSGPAQSRAESCADRRRRAPRADPDRLDPSRASRSHTGTARTVASVGRVDARTRERLCH